MFVPRSAPASRLAFQKNCSSSTVVGSNSEPQISMKNRRDTMVLVSPVLIKQGKVDDTQNALMS